MRYPLVIGNWKLHGSHSMVNELVTTLRKKLADISICTVAIAPPEIYLDLANRVINGSNIYLVAQDVDINLSGAFTGETSAQMLKDIGVKYTIIGHSERRIYHKESDKFISQKFEILKKNNLIPVLCIGETEAEKILGKTKEVCIRQVNAILKTQGAAAFENAVIAYEPIWAIGKGKSAIPEEVQIIHKFIRNYIAKFDEKVAEKLIIQYGGSVNSTNAEELFTQPDVDGALVGGSSLKADAFAEIVRVAELVKKNKYVFIPE